MHTARQASFVSSLAALAIFFSGLSGAAYSEYTSAKEKLDSVESDRLRPGARVTLSYAELNAFARQEAPAGVRNPKMTVTSPGVATGTALIDFGKLERSKGAKPGWLMSKLLDGERPVSVTARLTTARVQATVAVERVEISGIVIDGRTLDFLIQNFLMAMYPDAVIGKPFELSHHIDRISVLPTAVTIAIAGK